LSAYLDTFTKSPQHTVGIRYSKISYHDIVDRRMLMGSANTDRSGRSCDPIWDDCLPDAPSCSGLSNFLLIPPALSFSGNDDSLRMFVFVTLPIIVSG
jgi:hypothetical protein